MQISFYTKITVTVSLHPTNINEIKNQLSQKINSYEKKHFPTDKFYYILYIIDNYYYILKDFKSKQTNVYIVFQEHSIKNVEFRIDLILYR